MQPRMLTTCQILHRFSWLVSGNGWQCSAFTCIPSCVSTMYPAEVLQSLPKDPCLYSNFPCPFTSRSRLFALTTDLPGTADEHPNMVQGIMRSLASWRIKTLLGWFKVIEVWECCSLELWMIQRGTPSNLAISWCSCLSLQIRWNSGSSCIAALKGVTILQQQRSSGRWTYQCPNNAATASSHRNGKTQPTQTLGCITGVLTLSFPYEIPLWSSTKQWNCELVSHKSWHHRNPSLTKGYKGKQMSRVAVHFKLHVVVEAVSANPGTEFSCILWVSSWRPAKLCSQAWTEPSSKWDLFYVRYMKEGISWPRAFSKQSQG